MSHSIDPALTPPIAMQPAAPTQEPAFVGRERDLALLRGQLDATLAGRGGLVLISGGAGLGKTTPAESVAGGGGARGAPGAGRGRFQPTPAAPPWPPPGAGPPLSP